MRSRTFTFTRAGEDAVYRFMDWSLSADQAAHVFEAVEAAGADRERLAASLADELARLAPLEDPFGFAQVQAFNSYLCSSLHVAHAHRMRGHRWVDADDTASIAAMQRKVPESVGGAFELRRMK